MKPKQEISGAAVVCRTDEADCDDLDLKLSKSWLKIAIASVFAGQGMVFSLALNMTPPPFGSAPYWVLHGGLIFSSLVVLAFLGGPLLVATWGMVLKRQLSIEGLFTLSLFGAFAGSVFGSVTGEGNVYYEIVAIVIAIYTFGRMLSVRSQEKVLLEADRVRSELDRAVCINDDGSHSRVDSSAVEVGDLVRVMPGDVFPVDGRIRDGVGYVSETALTGEPVPVVRGKGERVRAGTHSVDGSFDVVVEATTGSREIDRILETVEDPGGKPSELQVQANRLSQTFLPVVALVSVGTAIFWSFAGGWHAAFLNSMAVLLVACPCALGLATPVAIWQGLYRLAQHGMVGRDGALVDALAATRRIFFDKTGTISENELEVVDFFRAKESRFNAEELLGAAYVLESEVGHPIARGIAKFSQSRAFEAHEVLSRQVVPGKGIEAEINIGGARCLIQLGAFERSDEDFENLFDGLEVPAGKRVYLHCDGDVASVFILRENLRSSVVSVWEELEQLGIQAEVLTGDPNPDPGLMIPSGVPMSSGMSAQQKLERVRASAALGESPIFVGDGVNDAAAMAAASASISLESGAALTRSRASAEILGERMNAIAVAVSLARGIRRRLQGNLVYAAAYNVVGMTLAAAGLLHPVFAALIMLVSSFLVTARALKTQPA